jgi:hypothetical protein
VEDAISPTDFDRNRADIFFQNQCLRIAGARFCMTNAQAVPMVGWPAKSTSAFGVKMRTLHVLAGSFFGRTKVVSAKLKCVSRLLWA